MSEFDQERLREMKQQALVLSQELIERRSTDPLRNSKPHAKQQAFIDAVLEGKNEENWFIAANRSGKSFAGAYLGARFARFGMPDWEKTKKFVGGKGSNLSIADRATSGWVTSVDFPSSRDVIQPKYFDNGYGTPDANSPPLIPDHEIEKNGWKASDSILKLKNGSIIGFKSCDSGRKKFQGAEKDWIHFDEEPDFDIYKESSIRISARRLILFGTCTILPEPGRSSGISWLFKEVIEPWQKKKIKGIGVFGASIYDNPHLPADQIRKLEDKYPEGSIERRIRLDGELLPGLLGATAYPAFQYLLNVRPQPGINPRRPLCWALDFNVSPMCSLLIQREPGLVRVLHEFVLDGGGLAAVADAFVDYVPTHQAEIWIYGDATSKRRIGQTGKSDYWVLMNHLTQYNSPLRLKVPEENPKVPDRINAVNQALKNSEGVNTIEIDPSCIELIADLEQVVRDQKAGIKKVTDPQNPYFQRTHTSDALGYYISYEMPVRQNSLGEAGRKAVTNIREPHYGAPRR